jgi:glycosyltransferase involved in cell wall biosynthesis
MHGWVKNDSKMKFNNFLEQLCLPFFDRIIAVSKEIRDKLTESSLLSIRVTYIANAIDTDKYKPLAIMNGEPTRIKKLLIVGRLSPEKGHINLLTALSQLNKKNITNWELTIIGDGELKNTLIELSKRLKLTEQIKFIGVQKNTLNFYQQHDIYVSSSLSEGMPLVVLEAMSCQVPVLSTPVGAIPDLITQSNGGVLCLNTSVDAIARCLETVLSLSSDELKKLSLNARKHIVEHYSLTSAIEHHENLYQTLTVNHKQGTLM